MRPPPLLCGGMRWVEGPSAVVNSGVVASRFCLGLHAVVVLLADRLQVSQIVEQRRVAPVRRHVINHSRPHCPVCHGPPTREQRPAISALPPVPYQRLKAQPLPAGRAVKVMIG